MNSLFEKIDWDNIHSTPAPFIPNPDDDTDTSYFIGTCIVYFCACLTNIVYIGAWSLAYVSYNYTAVSEMGNVTENCLDKKIS